MDIRPFSKHFFLRNTQSVQILERFSVLLTYSFLNTLWFTYLLICIKKESCMYFPSQRFFKTHPLNSKLPRNIATAANRKSLCFVFQRVKHSLV